MDKEFQAPEVLLGDTVFWFTGGSVHENPHVAVVVGIGLLSISVNVTQPWITGFANKDGVRHVDDKRAKSGEVQENGCWCGREDYFTRPDVSDQMKAQAGSLSARKAIEERAAHERLSEIARQREEKKRETAGVK